MKKILLLIVLLIPLKVNAKINAHLIDAELEIAGGLRVKELIVFDKNTSDFSRTINHKVIEEVWDNKSYNKSIYNGYSIENLKVYALDSSNEIDFSVFSKEEKIEIKKLDLKNTEKNLYTNIKNKLGSTINIHYEGDNNAFLLEYVITNIVVVHEDVLEVNYAFKNLNIGALKTYIRFIIPYPTTSDEYNFFLHGPSSGKLQELVSSNNEKLGLISEFDNLKNDINIRMTLPKEQVGIDVYLNKTNLKALDKILESENNKVKKIENNEKVLKYIKYTLVIVSVFYVLGSVIIYKYSLNSIFYLYVFLGLIISIFNVIFRYNIIYIYFIVIIPIIVKLIHLYSKKR
ncbi:MAG: hypothetical protein PHF21_04400 [Bacilli bacterium]|nr:hypothetical protein [Bacilli bacterium]